MLKSTKLGAAMLAVGTTSALAASGAAEDRAAVLAVTTGLASGAFIALGATTLIIGWTARRPAAEADKH
jgi:hypothetical protein